MNEQDVITRNKVRLVVKGYNQEEGINYDETFALVARLKAIRMLLTFASYIDFKLFQLDVKSTFLNGFIERRSILNNLRVLKILNFLTMCLSFQRLNMD